MLTTLGSLTWACNWLALLMALAASGPVRAMTRRIPLAMASSDAITKLPMWPGKDKKIDLRIQIQRESLWSLFQLNSNIFFFFFFSFNLSVSYKIIVKIKTPTFLLLKGFNKFYLVFVFNLVYDTDFLLRKDTTCLQVDKVCRRWKENPTRVKVLSNWRTNLTLIFNFLSIVKQLTVLFYF